MRFLRLPLLGLAAISIFAALHTGCGGGSSTTDPTTAAASSGDAVGSGGTAAVSSSQSSSSAGGGGATASSSSATVGSTGTGGTGGTGGTPPTWPTCDADPPGVPSKQIHDVWVANPTTPTEYWLPGVYVTGVAQNGCVAGMPCQIFVQQNLSYTDLAAGSQQAIKIFISANTAQHFVGINVGDRVDVYAHAVRYTVMGQNELLLEVNLSLTGCAKVMSTGYTPVPVDLDDFSPLTVAAYEDTVGPLLVRVKTVSGKPQLPTDTFGLWDTGKFNDAGVTEVVSLSPYFLSSGAFVGLANGPTHDFVSVTGVFGLFSPTASPSTKYKEIYPRVTADYPVSVVH